MERSIEAARLIPLTDLTRVQTEVANFHWLHALTNRFNGSPFVALKHVLAACDVYDQQGDSCSKDRLNYLIGEIELDVAEQAMPSATRTRLLQDADERLAFAEQLSVAVGDTSGLLLAQSARLRFRCDVDPAFNPVPGLHVILAKAKRRGDMSLFGQTLIALGDAQLAREKPTLACGYYRKAIAAYQDSQVKVYQLLARRKLEAAESLGASRRNRRALP
jgi:hypothetical protein